MGWRGNDFRNREETRVQAAASKRQLLVERMRRSAAIKLEVVAPSKFASLNRTDVESAGDRLRFRALNDDERTARIGPAVSLNQPTRTLTSAFFDALIERKSTAIMQWPAGQRDVLLLHPLAMLMLLGSSPDQIEGRQTWCAPVPSFRTLYYPWRGGSTGSMQRSLLIDRQEVQRRNARHLTRRVLGQPEESEVMSKLHETIGHLQNLSRRDQSQPHLAYATLAEIYPVFVADGGEGAPPIFRQAIGELYGRVRHGAAIDRLSDHRPVLGDPARAPFGLFGVTARADLQRTLIHSALGTPDICLLDLGPPALSRLGHGWEELVGAFVEELRKHHPTVPVLAITQDSYVQARVLKMLAPVRTSAPSQTVPASRILLRSTDGPLAREDVAIGDLTDLKGVIDSAGGLPVAALKAMSAAARGLSDSGVAGRIRRAMGGLRRAASLPCGLGLAHQWLADLEGQGSAETFLERRSGASVLTPLLEALDGPTGGAERERLVEAERSVRAAFDALEQETTVGSMLLERAVGLSRKSTPSLLVFGTEAERKLAARRLQTDGEHGEMLRKKLTSGKLRLVTMDDLEQVLREIETQGNRQNLKRLVLVAPTIDRLSTLLVRPWLPEEAILICDHALAGRIAGTYGVLVRHPDIHAHLGLEQRLRAIAAEAQREFEARAVGPVDLELEARPSIIEADEMIDLVDDDEGGRSVILLALQSGRSLRIRPGSVVVKYRRDAEANAFDRALAREVVGGDVIVVPDRAFVEEARRVLPVHVLALNRVALFHALVEAAVPEISGDTLAKKATTIGALMRAQGAGAIGQAAIIDWLRAGDHQKVPPEKRRPHAPQSRLEFEVFMTVLGAGALAEKIWSEGVQQMRVARQQAGLRMAQAFISVLVDPHGAAIGMDGAVRGQIGLLRQRALDHLDTVTAKSMQDRASA